MLNECCKHFYVENSGVTKLKLTKFLHDKEK